MHPSILIELPYCPPVAWLAAAWHTGEVRLEACENFQKGSYRNRCHIAGPNGLQRLSIPLVKGKHQQTAIREVRIAYDMPWQQIHWRSICTAYGNAPFFLFYADALAPFYARKFDFLFDFNLELLHFFLKKMDWSGQIRETTAFLPKVQQTTGFECTDLRNTVAPNAQATGWFAPAPYAQVFTERHGFLPNLSALDLLFCCGKHSGDILTKSCTPPYF